MSAQVLGPQTLSLDFYLTYGIMPPNENESQFQVDNSKVDNFSESNF